MDYITIILVLIIIGLVWVVLKSYQHNEADKKEILILEKEKNESEEMGKGLAEYNQKMQEKKNLAKSKILEILKTKSKVSNREIAKKINISSSSVRRYFDELEVEGKAKQVGKDGKYTFYVAI